MIAEEEKERLKEEAANGLSVEKRRESQYRIEFLEDNAQNIRLNATGEKSGFEILKESFNGRINDTKTKSQEVGKQLERAFEFVEKAFGDDNEMLLLVTELTVNKAAARFITDNGCDKYYQYNQKLMLNERSKNLREEIEEFKKMQSESLKADNI